MQKIKNEKGGQTMMNTYEVLTLLFLAGGFLLALIKLIYDIVK